jgi:hypothetical protein
MTTESFLKRFKREVEKHSCEWRKSEKGYAYVSPIRTRKTDLCPIEFAFRDKYPGDLACDITEMIGMSEDDSYAIIKAADYKVSEGTPEPIRSLRNRMLKILGFKEEK